MILIFDFFVKDHVHVPFNLGYLRTLHAAFPGREIRFHAQAGHLAELQAEITGNSDWFNPRPSALHPMSTAGDLGTLEAVRAGAELVNYVREEALSVNAEFISVLGVSADLLRAIRRQWTLKKLPRLDIVLHSSLSAVVGWRSKLPLRRYFDFVSELERPMPKMVRLVALERAIGANLRARLGASSTEISVLEHPVPSDSIPTAIQPSARTTVRIGFLGAPTMAKGFGHFQTMADRFASSSLEFHLIGPSRSLSRQELHRIRLPPEGGALSRSDYIHALAGMDLICLPLDGEFYQWVASGSLADAIDYRIPLLTTLSPVISDLTERFGPVGFVANTPNAMANFLVGNLRDALRERGAAFSRSLGRARASRTPSELARSYPWPVTRCVP